MYATTSALQHSSYSSYQRSSNRTGLRARHQNHIIMESNERFDIELSTFVDLAVSIVSLSRRYRESQTATSCYPGTESIIISQDKMRSEWKSRIQPWLVSRTNFRDSFEDCEDLKDFKFSTFFLQYTVPAMHLWNVMQEFYELDRVVCRISEKSEVKIVDWESMGFFEYLKSKKVEKKWRNSLNTIKRSTEARDEVSPKILPLKWSVKQNDETISAERAMPTESRIASIQYGVDTLAEAWEALRRSFTENLKDLDIAHSMFSEIQVAVERRFLMVDNALRLDDSMDVSREIEQLGIVLHYLPVYLVNPTQMTKLVITRTLSSTNQPNLPSNPSAVPIQ